MYILHVWTLGSSNDLPPPAQTDPRDQTALSTANILYKSVTIRAIVSHFPCGICWPVLCWGKQKKQCDPLSVFFFCMCVCVCVCTSLSHCPGWSWQVLAPEPSPSWRFPFSKRRLMLDLMVSGLTMAVQRDIYFPFLFFSCLNDSRAEEGWWRCCWTYCCTPGPGICTIAANAWCSNEKSAWTRSLGS